MFQKETITFIDGGFNIFDRLLNILTLRHIFPLRDLIFTLIPLYMVFKIKNLSINSKKTILFISVSFIVFIINSSFRMHTLYPRHLVSFIPLLLILTVINIEYLYRVKPLTNIFLVVIYLCLFFIDIKSIYKGTYKKRDLAKSISSKTKKNNYNQILRYQHKKDFVIEKYLDSDFPIKPNEFDNEIIKKNILFFIENKKHEYIYFPGFEINEKTKMSLEWILKNSYWKKLNPLSYQYSSPIYSFILNKKTIESNFIKDLLNLPPSED